VLLVTAGECTVTIDGRPGIARAGDAVIVPVSCQNLACGPDLLL